MHDEPNLYDPPTAAIGRPGPETEVFDLGLFIRWEKLRLAYNGVLAAEAVLLLLIMPPPRSSLLALPVTLVFYCFLANVCFCLGPVLDGYARWIGRNQPNLTLGLFFTGLILACGLTFVTVALLHDPALMH